MVTTHPSLSVILFNNSFKKNAVDKHWTRTGVPASEMSDYLCLQSGHNDLSERLSEFLDTRYKYKLDIVSEHVFYS